ncbi:hypothetical protein Syun_003974 [Stephania yunnanensis]|uniref:Uncharacterized protein n=1 Tax=Stephania yunnanensis TaxID=152371 RepID=A0AAP0Q0B7_9MAGN
MGNCLNVKRSSSVRVVHHEEIITPDQAEKKMEGHDHEKRELKSETMVQRR